jgi:hypothetical protein
MKYIGLLGNTLQHYSTTLAEMLTVHQNNDKIILKTLPLSTQNFIASMQKRQHYSTQSINGAYVAAAE